MIRIFQLYCCLGDYKILQFSAAFTLHKMVPFHTDLCVKTLNSWFESQKKNGNSHNFHINEQFRMQANRKFF